MIDYASLRTCLISSLTRLSDIPTAVISESICEPEITKADDTDTVLGVDHVIKLQQ